MSKNRTVILNLSPVEYCSQFIVMISFQFAALLTLPDTMPRVLKMKRVHEIIEILELEKCTNTGEQY